MNEKDYRFWTPLKRKLQNHNQRPFFHERQIWDCHLGENIGDEQDGKDMRFIRPVVVIRKFNANIFWGIPLTRNTKNLPFYFNFIVETTTKDDVSESSAILSQIRLIDSKRLINTFGYISAHDFILLKNKFKALLP